MPWVRLQCVIDFFIVDLEAEYKTVDPDQLATEKPPDPDLRCFQNRT